ncbi:MAG: dihydroneopterin aldolase [Clostridiales bacterium]|nr:dihydroneopterin aldolase [Clostridiales bacterium]
MDKICLNGLRFYACHGVYTEEKKRKQLFTANIVLYIDSRLASATDDIENSVDYGQVYMQVKNVIEENSFNLLETLAENIATQLLKNKLVQKVCVEVEKNHALFEGQFFNAAVIIERGRD